jgi:hypothetical protein
LATATDILSCSSFNLFQVTAKPYRQSQSLFREIPLAAFAVVMACLEMRSMSRISGRAAELLSALD